MVFELPVVTKSCFCLPLRGSFLVFTYFGVILFMIHVWWFFEHFEAIKQIIDHGHPIFLAVLAFSVPLATADFIFNILFIVGLHSKKYILLSCYYHFTVFINVIFSIAATCSVLYTTYQTVQVYRAGFGLAWDILFVNLFIVFSLFAINMYWLSMVKAVTMKYKEDPNSDYENESQMNLCYDEDGDVKLSVV